MGGPGWRERDIHNIWLLLQAWIGGGGANVTVVNPPGAGAVSVQDGGNSLTVDGIVAVNNGAGAAAVNIQDGGNAITVDGTVITNTIDGGDATQGSTVDAPASVIAAETAAASTGISLWKAIKNLLLLITTQLKTGVTVTGTLVPYSATGAGALALSTAEAVRFRLVMVTLQLSALPTTSELLSITINKTAGAAYDTVLDTIDPSVGPGPGLNNISYLPSGEVVCLANDQIDVAYTNTDGATFGAQIIIERL